MSSQSTRFDHSSANSSRTRKDRRPGFGKLAMGLLCLGLLCLVASSMQGSDPVISANSGSYGNISGYSKIQLLSCHMPDVV